jgi:ribosomal protein S18 acetylase RimI-like enzyme
MAEKEILIREATLDDLDEVSRLYNNYMFDSYLLKFGGTFVKKYLEIIIKSKICVTLVVAENHIAGFIMATFNSKKILSTILFNIKILCSWVRQILIRPKLVFESLKLVFYSRNTYIKDVDAELLFIAIEPTYRGKDLATNLIKDVLSLMRQKGIKKVKVSTLVKNDVVNALLKEMGFKIEKTFRLFKKYMYLYSYELC